jgi:hypothetical protein
LNVLVFATCVSEAGDFVKQVVLNVRRWSRGYKEEKLDRFGKEDCRALLNDFGK